MQLSVVMSYWDQAFPLFSKSRIKFMKQTSYILPFSTIMLIDVTTVYKEIQTNILDATSSITKPLPIYCTNSTQFEEAFGIWMQHNQFKTITKLLHKFNTIDEAKYRRKHRWHVPNLKSWDQKHNQKCISAPWFDFECDLGNPSKGQDPKQALPTIIINTHHSSAFPGGRKNKENFFGFSLS